VTHGSSGILCRREWRLPKFDSVGVHKPTDSDEIVVQTGRIVFSLKAAGTIYRKCQFKLASEGIQDPR
jgi:hypothetical protein